MTIGEVSRQAQVPPSTLRYYEALGLLTEVPRKRGRRVYDEDVFPELRFIGVAKATGFSLMEIRTFLALPGAEADWRPLARSKLTEIDATIKNLLEMRRMLAGFLEQGCAEKPDV